jgi:hypothetical protein
MRGGDGYIKFQEYIEFVESQKERFKVEEDQLPPNPKRRVYFGALDAQPFGSQKS